MDLLLPPVMGLIVPQPFSKDFALNNTRSDSGALGNAEQPFIAIAPSSTLARRGSTW